MGDWELVDWWQVRQPIYQSTTLPMYQPFQRAAPEGLSTGLSCLACTGPGSLGGYLPAYSSPSSRLVLRLWRGMYHRSGELSIGESCQKIDGSFLQKCGRMVAWRRWQPLPRTLTKPQASGATAVNRPSPQLPPAQHRSLTTVYKREWQVAGGTKSRSEAERRWQMAVF